MFDLSLQQKQNLSLFQIQSLNILTISNQDLIKFLEEKAIENPLLILKKKTNNIKVSNKVSSSAQQETDRHEEFLNSIIQRDETLQEHLLKQLSLVNGLSQHEIDMAKLVISNLDEKGFLIYSKEELIEIFEADDDDKNSLYDKTIYLVSSLEPIGCAATDVYDSLQKQLSHNTSSLLEKGFSIDNIKLSNKLINKDDFTYFSKDRLDTLAKKYDIDKKDIEICFEIIKTLDPNPARNFSSIQTQYINPSIEVQIKDSHVVVKVDDDSLPEIEIDNSFDRDKLSAKERKFVSDCEKNISLLSSMIDSRNKMLSSVAYFMVSKQLNWLIGKSDKKVPLMLKDIANYSDMSISTASRIVSSNYIRFENRILAMSSLLERAATENNSKSEVVNAIKRIIDSNPKKMSDEKIRLALEADGIKIARRTIQKYRSLYLS